MELFAPFGKKSFSMFQRSQFRPVRRMPCRTVFALRTGLILVLAIDSSLGSTAATNSQSKIYTSNAVDAAYAERVSGFEHFGGLSAKYRATQWNSEQGLPQNTVTALSQTRDGYVWIGTATGWFYCLGP